MNRDHNTMLGRKENFLIQWPDLTTTSFPLKSWCLCPVENMDSFCKETAKSPIFGMKSSWNEVEGSGFVVKRFPIKSKVNWRFHMSHPIKLSPLSKIWSLELSPSLSFQIKSLIQKILQICYSLMVRKYQILKA